MKFFLALALLSGSCIYGMEDNGRSPGRDQLKKSQEIPKCIFYYYDSPCGNPIIVDKNEFYEPTQIKIPPLATSQTLVPSQLIGAIVTITKKSTNE